MNKADVVDHVVDLVVDLADVDLDVDLVDVDLDVGLVDVVPAVFVLFGSSQIGFTLV